MEVNFESMAGDGSMIICTDLGEEVRVDFEESDTPEIMACKTERALNREVPNLARINPNFPGIVIIARCPKIGMSSLKIREYKEEEQRA